MAATVAALLSGPSVASPSPDARKLGFAEAQLGMTRQAWRARSAAAHSDPHDAVACSDEPLANAAGLARTPEEAAHGIAVCTYVRRYGRFSLPVSIQLPSGERATHVRYGFAAGRLVRITYRLPVDAYDAQVARFRARFGPAKETSRDRVRTELGRLPRVTKTWVLPEGSIVLVDPVAPFGDLSVTLARAIPSAGAG